MSPSSSRCQSRSVGSSASRGLLMTRSKNPSTPSTKHKNARATNIPQAHPGPKTLGHMLCSPRTRIPLRTRGRVSGDDLISDQVRAGRRGARNRMQCENQVARSLPAGSVSRCVSRRTDPGRGRPGNRGRPGGSRGPRSGNIGQDGPKRGIVLRREHTCYNVTQILIPGRRG
jgi:hypothetical protein